MTDNTPALIIFLAERAWCWFTIWRPLARELCAAYSGKRLKLRKHRLPTLTLSHRPSYGSKTAFSELSLWFLLYWFATLFVACRGGDVAVILCYSLFKLLPGDKRTPIDGDIKTSTPLRSNASSTRSFE